MSITRLNHFDAKPGREVELKQLLQSIIHVVESAEGCISCRLLESHDVPRKLVIVEEWDSVASHQEAARQVPPEKLQAAVGLLATRPQGVYYEPAGSDR